MTPNQGYINVTLDGACVVQIQRPEMVRLYEQFKDKMLQDQDHLLVDIHLSSFAESEKSLVVKVITRRATLDQNLTLSDVDWTVNLRQIEAINVKNRELKSSTTCDHLSHCMGAIFIHGRISRRPSKGLSKEHRKTDKNGTLHEQAIHTSFYHRKHNLELLMFTLSYFRISSSLKGAQKVSTDIYLFNWITSRKSSISIQLANSTLTMNLKGTG